MMTKRAYILTGFILTAFFGSLILWNFGANRAAAQEKEDFSNVVVGAATEYNARNEFALTQGGTSGVWNYGYTANDASNAFVPYSLNYSTTDCGAPADVWRFSTTGDQVPVIVRYQSPTGCQGTPTDSLSVHPGSGGERTVLRFVAPAAGTYQLTGAIQRANPIATTDIRILKNETTSLFTGDILLKYQQSFNLTVTMAANDTIDFSVGYGNGSYNGDSTTLNVTVAQPVTACLTAPANLQVNVPGENSPSDVQSINTNGSLVGDATYTNMGKVGRGFDLDGSGDYVRIEDNAAQRPATAVTAEGWFKFDNVGGVVSLISKPLRNTNLNSYSLYLDGGQLRGIVGNASQFTRALSGFTPQTGVWHHLAFTYDLTGGVSTLKLYANGVEVTSGVDGTANLPITYDANPYPLLIGGEFENNVPGFTLDGQADEVSVYGRALSQTELFDIVQQGNFGKCPPAACVQSPNNLVSWFAGEQNALDSRSNNHGTLFNGTALQTAKVGQGFKFDGVDDRVEIPDSPSLKPQNLTIETWVKFDSLNSNTSGGAPNGLQYIIFKKNQSVGNFEGYSLLKTDTNILRIGFAPGNGNSGAVADSTTVVTAGVYYHVVGTYDGSAIKMYVNGQLETTTPYNLPLNYATTPLFFGTSGEAGYDGRFNGVLDETSIYDRALTATEISTIYNAGQSGKCKPIATNPAANQVAWYSGDGDTRDFTGLNSNGTLNGNTNFMVGKVGQSFNFDGNDDNVEVANNANLNPTSQMTLETWVYKRTGGDADLVGKDGENSERQYWLGAASNGRFRPHLSTTGSGLIFFDGATQYNLNTWYHVAMTYDGATLRLYVNGVLDGQIAASGSIITTNQPLRIGGGAPTGQLQNYLDGKLDEISLYSRALSGSEISAVYNAGAAGKLKSVVTPVNFARTQKTSASFAPTTVQLSSANVTFTQITTAGTTSESGLDLGLLPALPANITSNNLNYNLSTTAAYTGNVTVCFNVPAIPAGSFTQTNIVHLENGFWVNPLPNTTTRNYPQICGDFSSLSPFAVVQGLAPTAATVKLSGRVTAGKNGVPDAVVYLTDQTGNVRTARASSFGYYQFDEVEVGQTYIINAYSRRYQFPTQIVGVTEETTLNLAANE